MNNEKDIKKHLSQAGITADKKQSQHFLKNENYIKALVEAGEIEENNTILEIGPGTGTITSEILEKELDKLIAVEKNAKLSQHLKQRFEDQINEEKLEVVRKDILNYQIPSEVDRCISNVPFQLSSEILEKLGKKQIQSSLILQEELGNRITADPGESDYSHLSVMTQYYFLPVKLQKVHSTAYYPEPEVETTIIKLYPNKERHNVQNQANFFKLSKALFTHKRKKTRNAFVDARNMLNVSKDKAKSMRDDIPHNQERVINLEIKQIKEISDYLEKTDVLDQ